MVQRLEREQEDHEKRFRIAEMKDRHVKSLDLENGSFTAEDGMGRSLRKSASRLERTDNKSRFSKFETESCSCQWKDKKQPSEITMMKERFAKLLLGEDMSGGGKGVSSALALSNAITNLAASVFGEQRRLEPMPPERRQRWRREIDWLLSVTDYIVEFVPSKQTSKDGTTMEIMTTQQRTDLHMNIPALRKLDAMLIDCLDNFKDQDEFYYVKANPNNSEDDRADDKWWLPTVKVPPMGLSDKSRKFMQHQKDCVNQVLKAAMAINAQALAEMEVPESYIESLPKNGRASLGELIYKNITVEDFFDPDQFLATIDLSSEHKILDLKNRIEASIVIWKRKMVEKPGKSSWSSAVSLEKREVFEDRAETILLMLKHRFPGISQSALDISKIQDNRDVGQAVLESYSRILESLAYTVMSRIEDVLAADQATQTPAKTPTKKKASDDFSINTDLNKSRDSMDGDHADTAITLLDVMGWGDGEAAPQNSTLEDSVRDAEGKFKGPILGSRKSSYLEHVGGTNSPTSRH